MAEARRVLLVEDDPETVQMAVSLLRDEPCRLICAASGRDALEIERRIRPDAIVISWALPDTTGDHLADVLSQDPRTRDIPLVLFGLEPWLFGSEWRWKAAQVV